MPGARLRLSFEFTRFFAHSAIAPALVTTAKNSANPTSRAIRVGIREKSGLELRD